MNYRVTYMAVACLYHDHRLALDRGHNECTKTPKKKWLAFLFCGFRNVQTKWEVSTTHEIQLWKTNREIKKQLLDFVLPFLCKKSVIKVNIFFV